MRLNLQNKVPVYPLVPVLNSSCLQRWFFFLSFNGFSLHVTLSPLPSAGTLDFSPHWHLSSELRSFPRCLSSLLLPLPALANRAGRWAAPAGRVSIGDILAGRSVALPPLHPVTHVRLAALPVTRPQPSGRNPARRPSGLQDPRPVVVNNRRRCTWRFPRALCVFKRRVELGSFGCKPRSLDVNRNRPCFPQRTICTYQECLRLLDLPLVL